MPNSELFCAHSLIPIEIVYALPHEQVVLACQVPAQTTVRQAIEQSGVLQRFSDIDLTQQKVGIFGHLVGLDTSLQPHDRVEIYRSLQCDPKQARRQRQARHTKN